MLDKAILKIQTEMKQNSRSTYIRVVGEFLLQYLEGHPEAAENILAKGKTIKSSLIEMRKVAEKQRDGNVSVLTDQEGFEVVMKYFGIDGEFSLPSVKQVPAPDIKHEVFDVRLEDLLL